VDHNVAEAHMWQEVRQLTREIDQSVPAGVPLLPADVQIVPNVVLALFQFDPLGAEVWEPVFG